MKGLLNVRTYEITTQMVRFVYLLREDVRKTYPASNKFININDSKDDIYQWCFNYGVYELENVFQKKQLDWNAVNVSAYPEIEQIILPIDKKKL